MSAIHESFPPAILLMGPTASGKTALACALCRYFARQNTVLEIISVDSALVFQDMTIGTAKPDAQTLAEFPHHLIDLISPEMTYSAARFRADALQVMADIVARGHIPLLVGGTMLYFRALLHGLADLPQADAALRERIEQQAAALGWPAMHAELMRLDPLTAQRLPPHDRQRIQRALEICHLTQQPMSTLLAQQAEQQSAAAVFPYRSLSLALLPSQREVLHQRIDERFHAMVNAGFLQEVMDLRQRYVLHADLPSMRAVGYRQAWQFLTAELRADEWIDKGIAATRQLAKRQLTWLNNRLPHEGFDCLDSNHEQAVIAGVERFLS